jgi:hypothetical protein
LAWIPSWFAYCCIDLARGIAKRCDRFVDGEKR